MDAPAERQLSPGDISDEDVEGADDAPLSTTPSSSESNSSILARRTPPRLPLKRTFRGELIERFSGWSSPARKRLKSSPDGTPQRSQHLTDDTPRKWGVLLGRHASSSAAQTKPESPGDHYKFWSRAERVACTVECESLCNGQGSPCSQSSARRSTQGEDGGNAPQQDDGNGRSAVDSVISSDVDDVFCVLVESPRTPVKSPAGSEHLHLALRPGLKTATEEEDEEKDSPILNVVSCMKTPECDLRGVVQEEDSSVLQLLVLTPSEEKELVNQRSDAVPGKLQAWRRRVSDVLARLKPPYFIILVGLVQVSLFAADAPQVSPLLLWDSRLLRTQPWRLLTYSLLHSGQMHLLLNVGVQTIVAAPLEADQGSLRVSAVYLGGAIAGSLGTAVVSPGLLMVGASAGVYALLISHVAHVILSADTLRYRKTRLCAVLLLASADAAYTTHHTLKGNSGPRIGVGAHCSGAASGLLLGLTFFRAAPGLPNHLVRGTRAASAVAILVSTASALAWTLHQESVIQTEGLKDGLR